MYISTPDKNEKGLVLLPWKIKDSFFGRDNFNKLEYSSPPPMIMHLNSISISSNALINVSNPFSFDSLPIVAITKGSVFCLLFFKINSIGFF